MWLFGDGEFDMKMLHREVQSPFDLSENGSFCFIRALL